MGRENAQEKEERKELAHNMKERCVDCYFALFRFELSSSKIA